MDGRGWLILTTPGAIAFSPLSQTTGPLWTGRFCSEGRLTAKLIERAGFPAYQVGGFALVGARYGRPDVDLEHFGEKNRAVQDVIDGCALPVLIDGDDGYGDAKNVTRTVRGYEALGASAIFLEDQTAPKRWPYGR